jgi:hypothetical protein
MKMYGEVEAYLYAFFRLLLDHAPTLYPRDEQPVPESRFGCGDEGKIPPSDGNRTPVVQPIANHCSE